MKKSGLLGCHGIHCGARHAACAALASLVACAPTPQQIPPTAAPSEKGMTAPPPTASPIEKQAADLIGEIARGQWDHPASAFDDALATALPPEKLHAIWEKIIAAAGAFQAVDGTRADVQNGHPLALVTVRYEHLRKVFKVFFDPQGQMAGLFYGPVPEEIEAKTRALVDAASHSDFVGASRDFDDVMRNALPPAKLADTWKRVEGQVGPFQAIEKIELKPEHGFWVSLATARFERDRLSVKVVYDVGDRVAGLFLQPVPVAWTAPPYVDLAAFDDRAVLVGDAPALPGIFTVPKGPGPFAALVLVHGSGPNDEDESVGGVKVFRDLAYGLASRGVAVLRYVKRTRVAPAGVVTQKEEVVDGAHAAIDLLRRTPEIDAKRIYLLGHSQGGYLAPRIAARDPGGLAGIVILAGPTRPLEDSLVEQFTYLSSLDPTNTSLAADLEASRRLAQAVRDPALRPDDDVALPGAGSIKGAYFLDVRRYDPVAVAKSLSCPLLVLQGERDYQVTMKDFERWRTGLASKRGATLKTYPTLNHLFVSGSGQPSPAEYNAPGHVAEGVIDDVAGWVVAPRHG